MNLVFAIVNGEWVGWQWLVVVGGVCLFIALLRLLWGVIGVKKPRGSAGFSGFVTKLFAKVNLVV